MARLLAYGSYHTHPMKAPLFPLLLALQAPLSAADQAVTLGDSLTFAYEGEFCFTVTIPFGETYGDNMPATVRNWIEILGKPAYRNAYFDQGPGKSVTISFGPFGSKTLFFRNEYNWAIPGLKVDQLRRFVVGEATFMELIGEDEDFESFATALDASTFDEEEDFNVEDMNVQISTTAERVVFFIGGNDVR